MLGPNDKFNNFLSGTGPDKDKSRQDILAMAKHKYTNMVATGDWLKVNPCNAKLVAFMSKLHELENK